LALRSTESHVSPLVLVVGKRSTALAIILFATASMLIYDLAEAAAAAATVAAVAAAVAAAA
jgi:hypothetical protein